MEKDKQLQKILLNKDTPEPSDNLEDRIMTSISMVANRKSSNHRLLCMAWIFFCFGLGIGVLIFIYWLDDKSLLSRSNILDGELITQILFSLSILFLFEKLYKLSVDMKKKSTQI